MALSSIKTVIEIDLFDVSKEGKSALQLVGWLNLADREAGPCRIALWCNRGDRGVYGDTCKRVRCVRGAPCMVKLPVLCPNGGIGQGRPAPWCAVTGQVRARR